MFLRYDLCMCMHVQLVAACVVSNQCKLFCTLKVAYAGGDKAAEDCKDVKGREMTSFHAALKDLVFAVSIVHCLGKDPKQFLEEE